MDTTRPSLTLPAELVERIDQALARLHEKTQALYVLLADMSGQLISAAGRVLEVDPVSLAALAASNLAATKELARLAGEPSSFGHLFHEGKARNIYLSEVAQRFVLVVVFDPKSQIGLVRLFAKQAVRELDQLAGELEASGEQAGSLVDSDFTRSLSEGLDRALGPWEYPSEP
ncbi:MAG: roadblock/LC7 domain-containing protein [Chloroflexi bacterium]|nr:roadblock/LC7 domain-containing protein [Chloroflexota bacterium]